MASGKINLDFIVGLKDAASDGLKRVVANAKQTMSSTMGVVRNSFSMMSSEMAAIGGKMGKAFGAVGGLLAGGLNPIMIAFTGAAALAGKWLSDLQKAKDEAKEAAAALSTALSAGFEKTLGILKKITDELTIQKNIVDRRNKANAANLAANSAEGEFVLSNSYSDKIKNAKTSGERSVVEAERALAIAQLRRADTEKKRAQESEAAQRNIEYAEYQLSNAQNSLAVEIEKYNIALRNDAPAEVLEAGRKAIQSLRATVSAAEEKLATAKNDEYILRQKQRVEQLANQSAINDADQKLADATKALADERARLAEEERKKKLEAIDRQLEEEDERREEERKSQRRDYLDNIVWTKTPQVAQDKKRLEKLNEHIENFDKFIKNIKEKIQNAKVGMATDHAVGTGWGDGGYKYNTDNNGNIGDFTDWDRAQRFAKRAENDEKSRQKRNERDANRAKDIRDRLRRGAYVNDHDKRWLGRYGEFENSQNVESMEQQLMNMEQQRNNLINQINTTIGEIKDALNEANRIN